MVPDTLGSVAAFFFFIAPGLLYELLSQRKRPSPDTTTFREISTVALISVVCTTVAVALLGAVRYVWPDLVVDAGSWIASGNDYVQARYELIARTLIVELLLAGAAAFGLFLLVGASRKRRHPGAHDPHPVLWSVTRGFASTPRSRGKDSKLHALARTHKGDVYVGRVAGIDLDADRSLGMLALQPPIKFHRVGEDEKVMPDEWDRVALPLSDLQELWLQWRQSSK